MQETFYTVEQIASLLKIHQKTVQRYIREGRLRAVKVGKSWRVSGHDLSVFTESEPLSPEQAPAAHISCVADVTVASRSEAIRMMNLLTASLNSKPADYGQSSMQTQYIPEEQKLRVTLYGGARFMAAMMDAISMLTEPAAQEID